jgi:hypothetical protein
LPARVLNTAAVSLWLVFGAGAIVLSITPG